MLCHLYAHYPNLQFGHNTGTDTAIKYPLNISISGVIDLTLLGMVFR
jgi:hypothetical protein